MLKYHLAFFSRFVTSQRYSSILYLSAECWNSGLNNRKCEKILDLLCSDRGTGFIWSAFDMPTSPFVSF